MRSHSLKNIKTSTLLDEVVISPQYQRSINLKHDLGAPESFDAFICHDSAQAAIEALCKQIVLSKQRAFTYTGPYGGGKSSLLNLIAACVCRQPAVRELARKKIDRNSLQLIDEAMPCSELGWSVIPVVGSRTSFETALSEAILESEKKRFCRASRKNRPNASDGVGSVFTWLNEEAEPVNSDGVLIVIDEMGKFLEGAARGEGDLLSFQTLAETISRMNGRVVVIGALHQAISAYGSENLDEWRKVQGRFSDIPFVTRTDEVVEMVSKAITHDSADPELLNRCKRIAEIVKVERRSLRSDFAELLFSCSPFHPITATLLGPISRRQYGQNERSVFAFLSSPDSYSFSDFLRKQEAGSKATYTPADLWDYLYTNLDPAIAASSDGHRWASAVESVERAEAKVDALSLSVVKNIAVIDLFKKQSSIPPSFNVLSSLYPEESQEILKSVLEDLCSKRILAFRRHQGAYAVFEGSDFDIEQAHKESKRKFQRPDLEIVRKYVNTNPIVAKRHYMEKGALRWLTVHLVFSDELETKKRLLNIEDGFGELLIVLPEAVHGSAGAKNESIKALIAGIVHPVLAFSPVNSIQIIGMTVELMGLQDILNTAQELHGDPVGRREVTSRMVEVSQRLESALLQAFSKADWISNRDIPEGIISEMASSLADKEFPYTPIIFNELVNRETLSTNAVKARKLLHYAIEKSPSLENLGFEGFPAERGLYESILKGRLHTYEKDTWGFRLLSQANLPADAWLAHLWEVVMHTLGDGKSIIPLERLYELWANPPFGVKGGLAPILMHSMLAANKRKVALYRDGIFCTTFKEAYIDEFLARPKRFGLRAVINGGDQFLQEKFGWLALQAEELSELIIARELVRRILSLPKLVQQTENLTPLAQLVRDAVKNANDPLALINHKLPDSICFSSNIEFSNTIQDVFTELETAFDSILDKFKTTLLKGLECNDSSLDKLRARAEHLQGQSGDFKLNSFILSLATWTGDKPTLEGILALAIGKPTHLWRDLDINRGFLVIKEWISEFKKLELLTSNNLEIHEEMSQMVSGSGVERQHFFGELSILADEVKRLDLIADQVHADLLTQLTKMGLTEDRLVPLLSLIGKKILQEVKPQNEN